MTKTKRLTKSVLLIVLALIMAMPIIFGGCDLANLFNGKGKDDKNKKVNCIELKNAFKTTYANNEELDVTGGLIDFYNAEGHKTTVALSVDMISGFTTATAGSRTMVITYTKNERDYTTTVGYTVFCEPETGVLYASEPIPQQDSMGNDTGNGIYYVGFSESAGQTGINVYFYAKMINFETLYTSYNQLVNGTNFHGVLSRELTTNGLEFSGEVVNTTLVSHPISVTIYDITNNGFKVTCSDGTIEKTFQLTKYSA